jgi:hypothetical protein
MTVYQSAKYFVDNGISVFPVRWRDKRPAVSSWEKYKTYLPTDSDLRGWFPCDMRNYAVVLGWNRLACLDFDDMDAWYSWQNWTLDNQILRQRERYMVKTRRGIHFYFHLLEDLHNLKLPGIDFKTSGYCVGPDSTHPSGHIYYAMDTTGFPIVEKLSDIMPAELLTNAINSDIRPVIPVTARTSENRLVYDIFEQAEQPMEARLSPVDKVRSSWRIETFFPDSKFDSRGFASVNCLFHPRDNCSAWINVDSQLFGCHVCNMKPMTVIGLYAALHQVDIKTAIKSML